MQLYQDKLTVDPAYRDVLARAGLVSVKTILSCLGDRVAAWSRTSDTVEVNLCPEFAIFVKRYHYHTLRHVLRGMFRGTFLGPVRARTEFETLGAMRSSGINVVKPVGYGHRRLFGFLRSCFVITEAVPDATNLLEFAVTYPLDDRTPQGVALRRRTLATLARQVRGMHEAGFVHGALFWRNVLVRRMHDGRYEFYFLDAASRRRLRSRRLDKRPAIRDVGCLAALASQFLTRSDHMRFARTYLQVRRLGAAGRRWVGAVSALTGRLREHELYRLSLLLRRQRALQSCQDDLRSPELQEGGPLP